MKRIFVNLVTIIVTIAVLVIAIILVKCLAMIPFNFLLNMLLKHWVALLVGAVIATIAISIKDAIIGRRRHEDDDD